MDRKQVELIPPRKLGQCVEINSLFLISRTLLLTNDDKSLMAEFTCTLSIDQLIKFLLISGDKNRSLHHPVEGRGIVQGLVWFTLCNAVVSEVVPSATMMHTTISPKTVCIAKSSTLVPVSLKLVIRPVHENKMNGTCEVYAPVRRGSKPALVFVAEGTIHQI